RTRDCSLLTPLCERVHPSLREAVGPCRTASAACEQNNKGGALDVLNDSDVRQVSYFIRREQFKREAALRGPAVRSRAFISGKINDTSRVAP
ncbi:MAG: hypothetical protein WCH39_17900, partial [Schlesneria sp.]